MKRTLRTLLVVVAASLSLASVAKADAIVDLLWSSTATDSVVATDGDNLTLEIILTAGPSGVSAFGMSVDYVNVIGSATVTGFVNAPNGLAPFLFTLGSTTDSGTQINNFNAATFIPLGLSAGQSFLAGTIDFNIPLGATPGTFEIIPFINGPPVSTDGITSTFGADISFTSTFNSAFLEIVDPGGPGPGPGPIIPEPTAALLFTVGLLLVTQRMRAR